MKYDENANNGRYGQTVDAVAIFRALGDETRLDIVRKLAASERSVSGYDVVCACKSLSSLSQPTTSHHFSKLTKAGVLLEEKHGNQKKYILNRPLLEQIGIDIGAVWNIKIKEGDMSEAEKKACGCENCDCEKCECGDSCGCGK